jgi:hypothetical protein
MIGILISLLITLLILGIIYWIAQMACSHFGAPPFVTQVIGLILLLIFLLYLLNAFGLAGPRWPMVKP